MALGRERAELLGERVARRRLRRVGEPAELPAEHLGLDPRVARDVLEQVRRLRAAAARARLPELAERRRAHARPLGPGRAVVREVGDAERRPEHVPEAVGPRELVRRGLERRDAAVHELRAAVRVGRLEPEVADLGRAAGHAAGDDGEERRRRVERRREEPRRVRVAEAVAAHGRLDRADLRFAGEEGPEGLEAARDAVGERAGPEAAAVEREQRFNDRVVPRADVAVEHVELERAAVAEELLDEGPLLRRGLGLLGRRRAGGVCAAVHEAEDLLEVRGRLGPERRVEAAPPVARRELVVVGGVVEVDAARLDARLPLAARRRAPADDGRGRDVDGRGGRLGR